jgi:pimeloyl-ACP methyl ester carboxylesterase
MTEAMHYEATGSGSPAIVLTHGLAATGATWAAQVEGLSPSFRVVTWDLRGHGRSPRPPGECRLPDLANDLGSVLDAAAIDRAVVLGHSAGGVVAMQFALDHPGRCAGLVLVGTASECNAKANEFYETLATIAVERGMAPVRRRLGLGASEPDAGDVDPETFAKVARVMANLRHQPLTSRLAEIRCPTLIIVGEKDFLGAGGSVILSRNIAGSELHIVPERGHGIFLEDPAGFNELVGRFLRSLSGSPPA